MIDNITIRADVSDRMIHIADNVIELGSIELVGIPNSKDRNLPIRKYEHSSEDGLYYSITGGVLTIKNSLHKSYCGHNNNDFTYSKLVKTIEKIEFKTGISSGEFEISNIEFGLNIPVEEPFKNQIPFFLDYRRKTKNVIRGVEVKYYMSEYNLKIYDKSATAKKRDKIDIPFTARFEIQYKRRRRIPAVKTLEDLTSKENLDSLFRDFILIISNVRCYSKEGLKSLSSSELNLYMAATHDDFWKIQKGLLGKEAYKSLRAKYIRILKSLDQETIIYGFIKQLRDKFEELMQN